MSDSNKIYKNSILNSYLNISGFLIGIFIISLSLIPPLFILTKSYNWILEFDLILRIPLLSVLFTTCFVLFGLSLFTISIIIRAVFLQKSAVGLLPLNSKKLYGFIIYHGLVHLTTYFFGGLVRGTNLLKTYFKFMGLKAGKNCVIQSIRISDFDLISIGDNSLIGFDAVINGHAIDGNYILRDKVKIGSNVVIGQFSIISPGVIIEDNVVLGANSFVPKKTLLAANKIYGGVPVKEITNSNSISTDIYENQINESILKVKKLSSFEVDSLLKLYELNRNETLAIGTTISNVFVSILGLLVTIFGLIVVYDKVKLISLIPILIAIAYAYILNSSMSMLKLSKNLCKVEIIFKKNGVRHFNWELKEGLLGDARAMALDNLLMNFLYIFVYFGSLIITFRGDLFTPNEMFLTVPVRKILMYANGGLVIWMIFTYTYFAIKRRKTLFYLKEFEKEEEYTLPS